VHFQSNQIKKNNPLATKGLDDFENESMTVFSKIKKNMSKRLSQSESVLACVSKSKMPVIVAGDFNETPYGYIYNEFRKTMKNSFQNNGTGFGFTMNNSTLFFLRIDQQFYTKEIACTNHSVVKDFAMSDHYPLLVGYKLESKNRDK
jgi:endonuclease/exonuclease/phosphatase (EEP) superfamily protein YafD